MPLPLTKTECWACHGTHAIREAATQRKIACPQCSSPHTTGPAQYGEYGSAGAYYASDEWKDIVAKSLASYEVDLGVARRSSNAAATQFYQNQIAACKRELGQLGVAVQQSLFA